MPTDSDSNEPSPGNSQLQVISVDISKEMKSSFIDYAMSIIVSRALPDVRDGLKPVHRRILYAMEELGLSPNKAYKKCARIVGEVLGKYHPHGDTAVYDALVRLVQPFSSRYPLIQGHGNFGTLDDNAAAMRYTEARLAPVSLDILKDIDSDTVNFQDNFDGSLQEPTVLPSRVPTLLLNGSSGIAVGMATNIPPHNLKEILNGLVYLIDNPDCEIKELIEHIPGPDFPSGGIIQGRKGIKEAYETGRGSIPVKALVEIEEIKSGKSAKATAIVVKELPYLVGPESLIEKIAELVKQEKIRGIADLNDESNRKGTRVVIKLKRDAHPQSTLNNLYRHTQLRQNFSVNSLALVKNKPKLLNLKEILEHFIEHRVEIVSRKAKFDLNKALTRLHIVEGFLRALSYLEKVIQIIRNSNSTEEARNSLVTEIELSEKQAEAVLSMQLRSLTGLEREKLRTESKNLEEKIAGLKNLLASPKLILNKIKEQLLEIKEKFKDQRITKIEEDQNELNDEDLIANENVLVFLTAQNYVKRIKSSEFESQNRAGRGKGGISTAEKDDLQNCVNANMHDSLLFFTNRGVVYSERVFNLPEGSRQTKGKAIVNIIPLLSEESITTMIPLTKTRTINSDSLSEFDLNSDQTLNQNNQHLIMLTQRGLVKKTALNSFSNVRKSGIIAINLSKEDQLKWVRTSEPNSHLVLGTREGMIIRYSEKELRSLGRNALGVKAINLREEDQLIAFAAFNPDEEKDLFLLLVTNDGYGKRVPLREFREQKRGGIGLIGTKFKAKSSNLVGLSIVREKDQFIIVTGNGVVIRQEANHIPYQSRMATGVRLQQIDPKDQVISVVKIGESLVKKEAEEVR